jgi:hypothetical protein
MFGERGTVGNNDVQIYIEISAAQDRISGTERNTAKSTEKLNVEH